MSDKDVVKSVEDERPFCETRDFQVWSLLGILTLFCAMSMDYLRSDLWMDEVITFTDYGGLKHWAKVFSTYPIANNHMLYSALLWVWIRLVPPVTEEIVRFPNLLIGLASVVFMHRQGRKLFGNAAGFYLATIWAFSPVFLSFFWQVRGYGLTLALALVATVGALHMLTGNVKHGLGMYALAAVLLPCVIPSNVIVTGTLWLFIAAVTVRRGKLRGELYNLIFAGVASVAGMVLYVPIWHKLVKVAHQTAGWPSGWEVIGHWCQAYFCHAVLFMLAVYGLCRRAKSSAPVEGEADAAAEEEAPPAQALVPTLLVCCVAAMALVSIVLSPFPRVLLGFLPALTFGALLGYREQVCKQNKNVILLSFFLLANALVFYQMTDYTMRRRLLHGEMPQNLLQQFYSRNNDVSTTANFLVHNPMIPQATKVFADFHFYLPLRQAWLRQGGRPGNVECLDGGQQFKLHQAPENYPYYPQLVLGYDLERARSSYERTVGYKVRLEPLQSPTALTIFVVTGIAPAGGQVSPMPPPEHGTPPPADGKKKPSVQISYPIGSSR